LCEDVLVEFQKDILKSRRYKKI